MGEETENAFDMMLEYNKALQAENTQLREAIQSAIDEMQLEINPSNYDHDQVCGLNAQSVNAYLILQDALKANGESK